jgi:hypothetical protein
MMPDLETWVARANSFTKSAHSILGAVEGGTSSRVFLLNKSYRSLDSLSIKQDDMFRQSLRSIESGVFRGAIVLCWAATVDYLQEFAASDGFAKLNAARPKWSDISTLEELREKHAEAQQVEAMRAAGYLTKAEKHAFDGLRTRRNECAHPSNYFPSLNEALGYFSEAIQRITDHRKRTAASVGCMEPTA